MSNVSDALKKKIDAWIAREERNQFGDPPGTMYAGGTPLFDERTGCVRDRYDYILEKHPELRDQS